MKLLTKQQETQLRNNHSKKNGIAYVKLFNPSGAGTWYLSELDENNIAYGLAEIHEKELGYTSLDELQAITTTPFGLPIERDKWFKPTPLKQLMA
jgi:hypothetical protein|tara:strand:- start:906 stop:1190 length:285 start_codon:yes stop_codon:yes gene_type:complete